MSHPDQAIWLVQNGQARFALDVQPPQDAEPIRAAIADLVLHCEKCLGQPVAWSNGGRAMPVRLELRFCPERVLEREEFEISAQADGVSLAASTAAAMGHAVHYFLEQAFGVRWLWPGTSRSGSAVGAGRVGRAGGDCGTVCPPAINVAWPPGITRHRPAWAWRRLWLGGAFYGACDPWLAEMKFGGVSPAALSALELWQQRNRLGGLNIADGHRWCQICPPEAHGRAHPEYFALINGARDTARRDGKHGNQPCTSNPAVVRLTAEYVMAQFRARPELDAFSISLNDGAGFCECPACRAQDETAGAADKTAAMEKLTDESAGADTASNTTAAITARIFRFANAVAEQVARVYPDKLLVMLVYSVYRRPPRGVRLHPNVMAQFCAMSFLHADAKIAAEDRRLLAQLGDVAERRGIYDYFVNGANGSLPRGFARILCRSIRDYHHAGCRYFAAQAGLDFASNGLVYYAAARMLWNPELDFEGILEDYCRAGFGPAAGAMQKYWMAFQERWENFEQTGLRHEAAVAALYPEAWRRARRAELEAAWIAAGDDAAIAARIGFVREGLAFLDLYAEACAAAWGLVERGAPPVLADDGSELRAWAQSCGEQALIERAVECRSRLMKWVDAHRDGFWIAAMWFQYQQRLRRGMLGRWMDIVGETLLLNTEPGTVNLKP